MTEVIDRRAGRVRLIDLVGRVLPQGSPGLRRWLTPGGFDPVAPLRSLTVGAVPEGS
ncbi:hypothetical protein [Actinoplanes derwentensis]|uniref:Uncharacterized protein n=1 Tax=Actinoplanes derwentensis TaxID=113562 RepID=A0A1H2D556_9ACTN|nr:hypothetical protein [Actinoplanes derwentensis]GID85413.1 hypothetical protein Ade03nite_43370 [Actinoplanes derwentensis]SDT77709.1 hypothetical protein SAMN04489716_8071 [Actinoplanes derwentensis]